MSGAFPESLGRLGVFIICLLSGITLYSSSGFASSSGSADNHGFAVGYTYSALNVCDFQQGLMLRLVNYRTLDPDTSFLGTRNFFVAMRIYGKVHACADALDKYVPQGVIHSGLLEKR